MGIVYFNSGFMFFLLLLAGIHATRVRRLTRQALVLRHLSLVVRQNLPLAVGLRMSANLETGKTRVALARCSKNLEMGMTLADALEAGYPKCSSLVVSIVRAAERSGTLPAALLELGTSLNERISRRRTDWTYRATYSLSTFFTFLLFLFGFSYFSAPKLLTIFADFGWTLPWYLQDVYSDPFSVAQPTSVIGWVMRGTYWSVVGAVFVLFVRWLLRLRRRRAEDLGFHERAWDVVAWYAWPFSTMVRNRAWQQALPAIRLTTAAGWGLPEAVRQATTLDVNSCLRNRLRDWSRQMRDGESPVESARRAGAPEIVVRALAVAVRDGALESPLYMAESYLGALVSRWQATAAQLVWPMITLMLATLAAAFAMGLIYPLKMLIDKMCELV